MPEKIIGEDVNRARALYERGETNIAIGRVFGVNGTTISRMGKRLGWKRKGKAAPRPGSSAALLEWVRRAIEAEIAVISAKAGTPESGERVGRALAELLRTLGAAKDLEAKIGSDARDPSRNGPDEPAVDIAELRRDLARRLDRLRAARGVS